MARIKVAVCEAEPELEPGSRQWESLCGAIRKENPDIVLLNEMPFGRWIASEPTFDSSVWRLCLEAHERGLSRLEEIGAPVVTGSRARELADKRVNEAYIWTPSDGAKGAHTKQFFPDEEGYYEARWFQAGERRFDVAEAGGLRFGFLICTDVMFNEHARHYGRRGAQAIFVPRAVGRESLRRWLVAMRMAAIVSGCYVLSSNRGDADSRGQVFGGRGWIVDPAGDLVAQTSPATPVVFHDLDTDFVARAQREYPCYVEE